MYLFSGERRVCSDYGESGSGKTTLLNILAMLDSPTSGEVLLNGKSSDSIREAEISAYRRDHLGFVFQDFNLLDTFSLRDNIYLPLVLAGKYYKEMERRLDPIAKELGIEELLSKYPYRGIRRAKTAGSGGQSTDHQT